MQSVVAMSESKTKKPPGRSRKPWSRKLTPAQIRVVAERYLAGGNVREVMKEFGIGRSSLYRYLEDYRSTPDVTNDVTHWRIEYQRVKDLAIDLALENKKLRAATADTDAAEA